MLFLARSSELKSWIYVDLKTNNHLYKMIKIAFHIPQLDVITKFNIMLQHQESIMKLRDDNNTFKRELASMTSL